MTTLFISLIEILVPNKYFFSAGKLKYYVIKTSEIQTQDPHYDLFPPPRVPELLFQPSMMGMDQAGIAETLEFVLKKFTPEEQDKLCQVPYCLKFSGTLCPYKLTSKESAAF